MSDILSVKVGVDGADVVLVRGRAAWALLSLIADNGSGCSYITHPAPRWSGYVHQLRRLGIVIETVREVHGGRFAGCHARYVLRSRVRVVEERGGESCGD